MNIQVVDWLSANRDRLLKKQSFTEVATMIAAELGHPKTAIQDIASWLQFGSCKCPSCSKGRDNNERTK
jgi:hypothetical protein